MQSVYLHKVLAWLITTSPLPSLCCSGMIVFKLERERPAFATHGSQLYYIKARAGLLRENWHRSLAEGGPICHWQHTCQPAVLVQRITPHSTTPWTRLLLTHALLACHQLICWQERYIRCYDFSTQRDNPLVAIRRNPSAAYNQGALHFVC